MWGDVPLDDGIAMRSHQQEMLDTVATDEHEAMARTECQGFDGCQPPRPAQFGAIAGAAQEPCRQSQQAEDKQQGKNETEIAVDFHRNPFGLTRYPGDDPRALRQQHLIPAHRGAALARGQPVVVRKQVVPAAADPLFPD